MPYRDKKDKNEHNSKYYRDNAEKLKSKRRERYQCLIKTQLKQKKIQEKTI
jgi:hypothetical protein